MSLNANSMRKDHGLTPTWKREPSHVRGQKVVTLTRDSYMRLECLLTLHYSYHAADLHA
ncbi:predicted protein [Chaetomium globosum CBS 148.51]|uniref:Uncharacterized protein n=1 Tax=Chaetomium globosum (strain ATCC 6205 / CBS 148.51 / DSM 1962 / NBRC 6347 / NRRL 1970) TaxID=306901 RepID=Q2HE87_CHAGB|nr:uncharacterized protein CHGG_01467 [Chaetomium globosum CBS 148.51]EAQ93232.1 predicted protein [Chaetomium globosum CBS 148.51]